MTVSNIFNKVDNKINNIIRKIRVYKKGLNESYVAEE